MTESNPLESVSNKYNADKRDTLIPIDNSWPDWVSSYNLTYFHTIKLDMSGHKGKFRTVCLYSNYLLLGFTDDFFFIVFACLLYSFLVCFIHFWFTPELIYQHNKLWHQWCSWESIGVTCKTRAFVDRNSSAVYKWWMHRHAILNIAKQLVKNPAISMPINYFYSYNLS